MVVLLTGLFVAACQPKAGTGPAIQQEQGLPQAINFVGTSMGSSDYARGVAWCDVLQSKTGIEATVEPTAGAIAMMTLIKEDKAYLAATNSFDSGTAFRGMYDYASMGPIPIRALQVGVGNQIGLLARRDSGLKSVADLKGKRIARFETHPDSVTVTQAYLRANGVDEKDVIYVPVASSEEAVEMLKMKGVDVACVSVGGGKTRDFDATIGGIFLSSAHDEKALAAALTANPYVYFELVKAGNPAVKEDTYILSHSTILLIKAKASDDLAYLIVKTFIENADELAKKNKALAGWTLERAVSEVVVPFHSGAIKYYKERGVWTDKLEKMQQEALKLVK
jgi:hypothetical protein